MSVSLPLPSQGNVRSTRSSSSKQPWCELCHAAHDPALHFDYHEPRTPGREISKALSRKTRTSLDAPRVSHDPNADETGDEKADRNQFFYSRVGRDHGRTVDCGESPTMTEVEAHGLQSSLAVLNPPRNERPRRKQYLTPHQRELLSILKLQDEVKPDGTAYTSQEIAVRLKMKQRTYARRAAELKVLLLQPHRLVGKSSESVNPRNKSHETCKPHAS